MGRKPRFFAFAIAATVVVVAACRDSSVTAPPSATAIADWRANVGASCTPMSLAQLYALADVVFSAGGPNANAVKSKIDQIVQAQKKNDTKKVNDAAFNANRLVFQKFKGPQPLAGTNAQVAQLISGIFCFAGIDITISDPANSNIIEPSAATQVVKSSDSTAGTKLPPGSITEPTVLEFTKVPNSFSTPGAGPLNTRLDQYPGFYLIQAGSASGSGPAVPVIVAICPDATVPASIRARLRLGHEKSTGFEIAPPADASFLVCPAPTNLGFLPTILHKALAAVMPKKLYAAIASQEAEFRGGVGGTASEFSPFDPVDPELEVAFRGGVGGTAGEFTIRPVGPSGSKPPVKKLTGGAATVAAAPGTTANIVSGGACTVIEAPWDSELEPECRPRLQVRTHLGTPLSNVPMTWTVTAGGGSIAAGVVNTTTCTGSFAASVTFNTYGTPGDSGNAGICWRMGSALGTNTVVVTPGIGGEVPPGVTYVPASPTFTATAIKVTPVVAISCPVSVVYNNAAQTPCSTTVTDAVHSIGLLPVPVAYGPTTPPRNVGSYTADANYLGAAMYFPAAGVQKTFQITPATPVVSLTCDPSVDYTGAVRTPCSSTATGVGGEGVLAPAPTVTYDPSPAINVGHYAVTAAYAPTQNYTAASATPSATKIMGTPSVTLTCPVSAVYSGVNVACTAAVTGQPGAPPVGSATVTYGPGSPNGAGTYTANASYPGSDLYHPAAAAPKTFEITPAPTVTLVTCSATSFGFTGAPITPCSANVTGPGGFSLALTVTYASNTNGGTATASATFGGGTNHLSSNDSETFQITPVAPTVAISCPLGPVTYDGTNKFPCIGSATGVAAAVLPPVPVTYSPTPPNVPGAYTGTANFAATANYTAGTASGNFVIKGTPNVTITCVPATFNGGPQFPCTATVTSPAGGGFLATAPVSYTPNPPANAGTYTASASYGGSPFYYAASAAPVNFSIAKFTPTVVITCNNAVFTGHPIPACTGQVFGVGGAPIAPAFIVTAPTTPPLDVGHYTALASFGGGTNYNLASAPGSFDITPPTGGFFDGFETPLAWTVSGLWNRNGTLTSISNLAFPAFVSAALGDSSAGYLPAPFTGTFAHWFGLPAAGNYFGAASGWTGAGGTPSPAPQFGQLISPTIAIPTTTLSTPRLEFNSWFEIEGFQPVGFDIMRVSIQQITPPGPTISLGVMNPKLAGDDHFTQAIPFTSGGYNVAPVWNAVDLDMSAFRGKSVRVIFTFGTGDLLYNGFRGWIVDNVRVSNSVAAIRAGPSDTRAVHSLNPEPPPGVRPPE